MCWEKTTNERDAIVSVLRSVARIDIYSVFCERLALNSVSFPQQFDFREAAEQFRRHLQVRLGGGQQAKVHMMVWRLRKEPLFILPL